MTRTVVGFLGLLILLPALQAEDKPETLTAAQQYQALVKEYGTAVREFQKANKEAKTSEAKQKVYQEKHPQPDKFAPRFLQLAEKNPKDPVAVDALVWVVSNVEEIKNNPMGPRTKAVKILLRDHLQSEKMAILCQRLSNHLDEDSRQLLRAVLEKCKHRPAQALACFALAQAEENRLRLAWKFTDIPEAAEGEDDTVKEFVEELVKAGPEKLSKEAEVLYERIVKDFADVPKSSVPLYYRTMSSVTLYRGTLAELAKERLEELRHPILVGKPVPEIEGEDIDGVKFKLSDYRGKVVLLDFWGNW